MTDTPGAPAPPSPDPLSRSGKPKPTRGAPLTSPRDTEKKLLQDVRVQLRKAVIELGANGATAEPPGSTTFVYCYSRFVDSKRLVSWLRRDLTEALNPLDEPRALGLLRVINLMLRSRTSTRRLLDDERLFSLLHQVRRSPSDRLREEVSRIDCSVLAALRRRASSSSGKNLRGLLTATRATPPPSATGVPIPPPSKPMPFWAHHIEVISEMLCAIEWQQLSRLHFTDFTVRGKGVALRAYIERTNLLSEWVATNILVQRSAKQQCHIFGNFVRIAHRCLENGGFNVASALISGCRHGCVERLHRTWNIPRSYAYVYEVVGSAVSPTRGYAAYRSSLETAIKANKPFLPIVALVLRDLTLVEDGNPDVLDDRVNVEKLNTIHKAIAPVMRAIQLPYKRPEGDELDALAKHLVRLPCRKLSELEALSAKFRPYSRTNDSDESVSSVKSVDSEDSRAGSDVNVSELVELALDSEASSSSDHRR